MFEYLKNILDSEEVDLRSINEIRFQGYIASNLIVTENGFAYILLL
mgnify:CR=1 FL=1